MFPFMGVLVRTVQDYANWKLPFLKFITLDIDLLNMATHAVSSYLPPHNPCHEHMGPACHREFKTTRGQYMHLTTAQSCQWYKMGQLADLDFSAKFADDDLEDDSDVDSDLDDELPWDWSEEQDIGTDLDGNLMAHSQIASS